jgi:hypothetical protein
MSSVLVKSIRVRSPLNKHVVDLRPATSRTIPEKRERS